MGDITLADVSNNFDITVRMQGKPYGSKLVIVPDVEIAERLVGGIAASANRKNGGQSLQPAKISTTELGYWTMLDHARAPVWTAVLGASKLGAPVPKSRIAAVLRDHDDS